MYVSKDLLFSFKGGKYISFEAALDGWNTSEYARPITQAIPSAPTVSTSTPGFNMRELALYLSTSLKDDIKDIITGAVSSELGKLEKQLEKRMESIIEEGIGKVIRQDSETMSTHGK